MKKMSAMEIQKMLGETGINWLDVPQKDQDGITSAILADYKVSQLNMGAYKKSNFLKYSELLRELFGGS